MWKPYVGENCPRRSSMNISCRSTLKVDRSKARARSRQRICQMQNYLHVSLETLISFSFYRRFGLVGDFGNNLWVWESYRVLIKWVWLKRDKLITSLAKRNSHMLRRRFILNISNLVTSFHINYSPWSTQRTRDRELCQNRNRSVSSWQDLVAIWGTFGCQRRRGTNLIVTNPKPKLVTMEKVIQSF